MMSGNYVLYGDRPEPEPDHVVNNLSSRIIERKLKRKCNRTANELERTLNITQLENDTDSIKYERKVNEPRLLRYVPTTDVEENYVNDKFETYDMKPSEEPPRRYSFAKKPKNPADGSVHYAYSRSSSSCSSPNGNLPTISEHAEQYGTFRVCAPKEANPTYDNKLDKYFTKPRDGRKFTAKGSHPDSLYRVPIGGACRDAKMMHILRMLRWPAALITVCVALGVFVYLLMPDMSYSTIDRVNSTYWSKSESERLQYPTEDKKIKTYDKGKKLHPLKSTKTTEIDFYDSGTSDNNNVPPILETTPDDINGNKKLLVAPVFPRYISPEVQYGNERADSNNGRTSKNLSNQRDKQPEDSTLKPHITQKPEKPLAIYFKDGTAITSTSTETIVNAETTNDFIDYKGKGGYLKEHTVKEFVPLTMNSETLKINNIKNKLESLEEHVDDHRAVDPDIKFTSGHSKLFGISIEDAEKFKSTTQNSLYNTRVSPTLPVWRDVDDTTTNKYPVNYNAESEEGQPQCRSTRLSLCRGVLPYDLTSTVVTINGIDVMSLLPQFEYLVMNNCSLRARQFACILLEPECSPAPLTPRLPCSDFCRAILDGCDGQVPQQLASLFQCNKYPSENCVKARSPCFERELMCGDGSCISRDWICDGHRDCSGGEDEASCSLCSRDEYSCPSGGCILKSWLCDGYTDCPKGEDEFDEICALADVERSEDQAEAGVQPAASVLEPSVKVPNPNDYDTSRELLMTSDTRNPYRRNYTRRPSASRLTPYKRPTLQNSKVSKSAVFKSNLETDMKGLPSIQKDQKSVLDKIVFDSLNNDTSDELNLSEINFFHELEKAIKSQVSHSAEREELTTMNPPEKSIEQDRIPVKSSESKTNLEPIEINKDIDKFSMFINDTDDGTKAIEMYEEDISHEFLKHMELPRNDTSLMTAHKSPCPSGELRCVDGRCITFEQLCDGTVDCTDHADEDNCFT